MHLLTAHFFLANPLPSNDTQSQDGDHGDDSLLDTARFCGATTIVSERADVFAPLANGTRVREGIEYITYQEICTRIDVE